MHVTTQTELRDNQDALFIEHYSKLGWVLVDLPNPEGVWQARGALEKELCRLLGHERTLEEYHLEIENDQVHIDLQSQLSSFFHAQRFASKIIRDQVVFFKQLIGIDLLVQHKPYLRITRPGKPQDNIGYHRDTFYGGSPYEISVLVPYVNLPKECSLSVMDGSHVLSEKLFPTRQEQNTDTEITKGSKKHQLGFLYAPKIMDSSVEQKMKPIPIRIGQALIFSLSTVHGSVENRGNVTRWSTDIRLVNALAPVDLSSRPNYYEVLQVSPVTRTAREYISANIDLIPN